MGHARKDIRDQVRTILTGLTTTGANVFEFRVYPMEAAKLPGLIIYTREEESEPASMGVRQYLRQLSLAVEGYAQATADVEDTLDLIASEIETAIEANRRLNGYALDTMLASTEFELSGDGKKQVGVITLTYKILYKF